MSYCDVNLVRSITGLSTGEVRDQRIRDLRDDVAIGRINDDIQTRVDAEKVSKINNDKENIIDGNNTEFYLKEVHNSFRELGDLNDDGIVDSKDIKIWSDKTDNNIEVQEILDAETGKYVAKEEVSDGVFEPISSTEDIYVRYRHAPVSVAEPNSMVEVACAQLTGAYCFSNIETSKLKNFSIGDVTIRKQTQGFSLMMDQYTESMRRIVNRELIAFDKNKNEIADVIRRRTVNGDRLGGGKTVTGRFSGG